MPESKLCLRCGDLMDRKVYSTLVGQRDPVARQPRTIATWESNRWETLEVWECPDPGCGWSEDVEP